MRAFLRLLSAASVLIAITCGSRTRNDSVCRLPKDVGPCKAAMLRYFYNADTGSCEQFTYGGCQGNANNFETIEACREACKGKPSNAGPCPGIEPRPNSPCERAGLECTYGHELLALCRDRYVCNNGLWSPAPPIPLCRPPLATDCPATIPASWSSCGSTPALTYCEYPDESVVCHCIDRHGLPVSRKLDPPQWRCYAAPTTAGCPAMVPNEGTACHQWPPKCAYDQGIVAECTNETWVWVKKKREDYPICASPDTPVATPGWERPIASLEVSDIVYSVDQGQVKAVPIRRIRRTPVDNHHVIRVALESGALLEMSPGHPTADGRRFADLQEGDLLDGMEVLSVDTVPYPHGFTYDILPDSDTGTYFAAGTLVGSTLEMEVVSRHLVECRP